MIRIDMTRQNTNHPDKRRRHQGRVSCEAAGRRFEAQGPAPIYKLATLLWLHGHDGAEFEVWDDLSPFGRPGGLAMRGKVRIWARLVKGAPKFDRDALPQVDFSPQERDLVTRAAGSIVEIDSLRPDNGHTAAISPLERPNHPQDGGESPTRLSTTQRQEVA